MNAVIPTVVTASEMARRPCNRPVQVTQTTAGVIFHPEIKIEIIIRYSRFQRELAGRGTWGDPGDSDELFTF